MAEREGGEDEDRLLRARLEKLSVGLKKQRGEMTQSAANGGKSASEWGLGVRAASEFVAAIVVGGLIGWQLDVWLGTKPAFLIVFLLLGGVAGIWNVIRAASPSSRIVPARPGLAAPAEVQNAPPGADEDED
jgi:ATP synthase protein I